LEAVDELSRVLVDGFRAGVRLRSHEIAPGLVPCSSTFSAPVDSLMEVARNGQGVVVNLDALPLEPPRKVVSLGEEVVLFEAAGREPICGRSGRPGSRGLSQRLP
jgi:hypothetical protein